MKRVIAGVLTVQLVSLGCGGDDGPTEPTPRAFTTSQGVEGPLPASLSFCLDFKQEATGEAYASAGLTTAIELGTGTCAGTRTVIARSDTGEIAATVPAGYSFVRIVNTTGADSRFRLTLRYLVLA